MRIFKLAALLALLAATPAVAEVYDWSQTAGSNNTADTGSDVQWSEGMSPSDVNDSARAMMAELRKYIDELGGVNTSAGTNTITLTTEGSADNLEDGREVCFIVGGSNTAATTFNPDSLGAKKVFVVDGTELTGGELVANTIACLVYDTAANSAAGAWRLKSRFITLKSSGGLEAEAGTGQLQRSALTGDVTASAGSNATTVANNAVTYAKMQDVTATDKFIGRDTAGSGDPEEISVSAAAQMLCGTDPNADRIYFWDDSAGACGLGAPNASLTISGTTVSIAAADFGDVVTTSSGTVWDIDANAVALSTDTTGNYVLDVADGTGIDGTASAEGATYTPTLDLTEKSSVTWGAGAFTTETYDAGAVDPVFTFSSGGFDISGGGTSMVITLDDQAELRFLEEDAGGTNYIGFKAPAAITSNVTCTLENDSTPIPDSCVGDGVDASGSGGDEFGTNADRGDATVSSSGSIITIDNDVVSFAKMANLATDSLVGRDTAGTGDPEALSVGGGVEFTGSGGIQRSALTGDITASAGSNTTDIASGVVGTAEVANDSLTANDLAADSVSASEIATSGVTTTEILDGTIGIADLAAAVTNAGKAVGEIFAFGGTACPSGSLEADGSSVLRSTYASLYTAIGTAWGTADGTHFNLPETSGTFLRGWDHGAGNDEDRASRTAVHTGGATGDSVGSWEGDDFEAHSHGPGDLLGDTSTDGSHTHDNNSDANAGSTSVANGGNTAADNGGSANTSSSGSHSHDVAIWDGTTDEDGGSETRPENVNVLFCVYTGV